VRIAFFPVVKPPDVVTRMDLIDHQG